MCLLIPSGSASLHLFRSHNCVWKQGGVCFWPGDCEQRQGKLLCQVHSVEKWSGLWSGYVTKDTCNLFRTFLDWKLSLLILDFIQVLWISCHDDVNNTKERNVEIRKGWSKVCNRVSVDKGPRAQTGQGAAKNMQDFTTVKYLHQCRIRCYCWHPSFNVSESLFVIIWSLCQHSIYNQYIFLHPSVKV